MIVSNTENTTKINKNKILDMTINELLTYEEINKNIRYNRVFSTLRRWYGVNTPIKVIYESSPDKLAKIFAVNRISTLIIIKFFIEYDINYVEHHSIDVKSIIDFILKH